MSEHLSADQIARWMIGERSDAEQRHAMLCSQCAEELRRTGDAFALLRESGKRWSDHWYAKAEFAPRAAARPLRVLVLAGVSVAVIAAAFLMVRTPAPPTAARQEAFVMVPYVVPAAPYERTRVVRLDVPASALMSAGLDVRVADAGATVRTDVLVGQDGRTLAVRLVRGEGLYSDRR